MPPKRPNSKGKAVSDRTAFAEEKQSARNEEEKEIEEKEQKADDEPVMTRNQQRVQFSAAAVKQIVHPHMGSVLAKEQEMEDVPTEQMQRLQEQYQNWVEQCIQEQKMDDGDGKHDETQEVTPSATFTLDKDTTLLEMLKVIGHDRCPDEVLAQAVKTTMLRLDMGAIESLKALQYMYAHFYAPASTFGERLRRACARGDADVVHELIARGCEVACCNGLAMTPLHCCAEYDQVGTAELVLANVDADSSDGFMNAKDRYGWTALMTAVNNGAAGVVSLLLRRGADMNVTNKQGRVALHVAAAQNRVEILERLLKEPSTDVNIKDNNGMTPAHVAAMNGSISVYNLLSAHDQFDVEAMDSLEHTAKDYLAIAAV